MIACEVVKARPPGLISFETVSASRIENLASKGKLPDRLPSPACSRPPPAPEAMYPTRLGRFREIEPSRIVPAPSPDAFFPVLTPLSRVNGAAAASPPLTGVIGRVSGIPWRSTPRCRRDRSLTAEAVIADVSTSLGVCDSPSDAPSLLQYGRYG